MKYVCNVSRSLLLLLVPLLSAVGPRAWADECVSAGDVFSQGQEPPAPFGKPLSPQYCGPDPTQDELDCASYPRCATPR